MSGFGLDFPKTSKLNAESRLVLIRVKIERSKHLLSELEKVLHDFLHSTMYVAMRENNSPHIRNVDLKKFSVQSFDALSIAGDVVHNLRAALDHLVWQLVICNGNKPQRRTAFPIGKNLNEYEHVKLTRLAGVNPMVVKTIDELKPYKGGNNLLWRVDELDRIDKHRTLLTAHRECLFVAEWLKKISPAPYLHIPTDPPHFEGIFAGEGEAENSVQADMDAVIKQNAKPAMFPSLRQLVDYVEDVAVGFKPLLT